MSMSRSVLALLLLVGGVPAATASPWPPPPAPQVPANSGTAGGRGLALVGGTVHVGDGSTVLPGATVLIREGRIVALGRDVELSGAAVLDVSGLHVSPGLTAVDTVLGLVEVSAVRATRDDTEVGQLNPHVRALAAVNPDSEQLGVALAGGVLHALVTPRGGVVSGTGALIRLRGWTREDMTLREPAALRVSWPAQRLNRAPKAKPALEDQERQRAEALDRLDDLVADARLHLAAAPARRAGQVPRGDRDVRLEALAPVLAGDVRVLAAADSIDDMRSALAWAKRQGLSLVLVGARDGWRIAAEIAAAGVPVIVTPVRELPSRSDEPYDTAFRNPVLLHEAGVTFMLATGGDSFSAAHVRSLPDEAAMAIQFGLPPAAALRAVTLTPAEVFGVSDEIGTVAVGLRADLVVWSGPPLEVSSRAETILLDGEIIPADDRHSRLWRKYRARPALGK